MKIDTTFLRRCIASLERALEGIGQYNARDDDFMHDIYRAACVKEFELVLGQSGTLLRKRLADRRRRILELPHDHPDRDYQRFDRLPKRG